MNSPLGYLTLVLHAHLPFVRHPELPDFLEEDWFFEGMVETYAPLLVRFEKLRDDGIPFRITLTVSPPLLDMMDDHLLRTRLWDYIEKRKDLLRKEMANNAHSVIHNLAKHYFDFYTSAQNVIFHKYNGYILDGFRSLQDSGHVELITCNATHAILPLVENPLYRRAQIRMAVKQHEARFGRKPRGTWLAECAYEEGVDVLMAKEGVEYFFMDTHGLVLGDPPPVYGVYAPVITPSGVNIFGRDPDSSKQVWSKEEGYPGEWNYREFYRDLGFDAHYDYVKPYLHSVGVRHNLGIKYHKITGSVGLGERAYYDPFTATQKASDHANHFLHSRQAQVRYLRDKTKYPPIIVSPYDAELFGHWWYEGPQFLEFLIRRVALDQSDVELITASDYLDRHPIRQIQKPNPSTWGAGGYNLVWLNGSNSWLYRHQHWAEGKLENFIRHNPYPHGQTERVLNQLLRELTLIQSSDWAFIMTTGTTVAYAERRFKEHMDRFRNLASQFERGEVDEVWLRELESKDCIFKNHAVSGLFDFISQEPSVVVQAAS